MQPLVYLLFLPASWKQKAAQLWDHSKPHLGLGSKDVRLGGWPTLSELCTWWNFALTKTEIDIFTVAPGAISEHHLMWVKTGCMYFLWLVLILWPRCIMSILNKALALCLSLFSTLTWHWAHNKTPVNKWGISAQSYSMCLLCSSILALASSSLLSQVFVLSFCRWPLDLLWEVTH